MKTARLLLPAAKEQLSSIDRLLEEAHKTSESTLGNKSAPLDEAIYIILSFQTDLPRVAAMWSRLRAAYTDWDELERAPVRNVAAVLRQGGLHNQKARVIKRLLSRIRHITGNLSLDLLQSMSTDEAERFLTRLPGLAWKGARCILLYSLDRDVLPVDGNTFRILKRTGVIPSDALYRRKSLHDALQLTVQPARRRSLHVNLVVHGQRICLPRRPKCPLCPLNQMCPTGLASSKAGTSVAARSRERKQLALQVT
jgi:endonuclease-3